MKKWKYYYFTIVTAFLSFIHPVSVLAEEEDGSCGLDIGCLFRKLGKSISEKVNLDEMLSDSFDGIRRGIEYYFNHIVASIAYGFNEAFRSFTALPINSIEDIINRITGYFGSISQPIKVMTIAGLAFVFYKFGLFIFKAYFKQDNQYPPSIFDTLKRLMVALIALFIGPYIIISAYFGTSYLGIAAARVLQGSSSLEVENPYEIYNTMDTIGVDFNTQCVPSGSPIKVEEVDKQFISHLGQMQGTLEDEGSGYWSSEFRGTNTYKALSTYGKEPDVEAYKKVWYATCAYDAGDGKGKLPNGEDISLVYEGVLMNGDIPLFGSNGRTNPFLMVLCMIVVCFYCIFASYQVIRRFLDILFLCMFFWFYAGNSIEENNSKQLLEIAKRLKSICLSQFAVIFELQLFLFFMNNVGFTIYDLALFIAWCSLLMTTPTILANMTHDTGSKQLGLVTASKIKDYFNS